jgi:hypothetical protein
VEGGGGEVTTTVVVFGAVAATATAVDVATTAVVVTARRVVRRATPAPLTGVAGLPTIACASFTEKLPGEIPFTKSNSYMNKSEQINTKALNTIFIVSLLPLWS